MRSVNIRILHEICSTKSCLFHLAPISAITKGASESTAVFHLNGHTGAFKKLCEFVYEASELDTNLAWFVLIKPCRVPKYPDKVEAF